jgi:hypothetical protein
MFNYLNPLQIFFMKFFRKNILCIFFQKNHSYILPGKEKRIIFVYDSAISLKKPTTKIAKKLSRMRFCNQKHLLKKHGLLNSIIIVLRFITNQKFTILIFFLWEFMTKFAVTN